MNVILFQFLTFWSIIIILASFLVYYSNKGIFGNLFRDMFKYDNKFEYIALLISSCIVLNMIYSLINIYIFNDYVINCMMNNTNTNTNSGMIPIKDTIRFWPSGVPQTWGIMGAAAIAYRGGSGTPRMKAVAAVGTLGLTVPTMLVSQAIYNPHGFHALMYSLIYYKTYGIRPPTIPTIINKEELEDYAIRKKLLEEAKNRTNNTGTSSFLPNSDDNSIFENFLPDSLSNIFRDFNISELFRPIQIEGYLDDLIGQQLFIHILMFITVISLIILFTLFLCIQVFLSKKEYFLNLIINLLNFTLNIKYF
uniref:hypothetical protein n=1 Tax=Daedaleopsis nitida TaxID=1140402 RepID=UPI0030E15D7E